MPAADSTRASSPEAALVAPVPSRSIRRTKVDPIGPPSDVIDPAAYLRRVEEALSKASAVVKEVEAGWLSSANSTELTQRCSTADLLAESVKLYDDDWVRGDIHQWTNYRWLPAPPPPRRDNKPDEDDEVEQDEDESEPGSPIALKAWSGVTLEGHPSVEGCFEAAEQSSLNLLKPPQVAHFVRRTGLVDYNAIPALRPSVLDTPRPTHKDPLTHVLYTFTFHTVPRTDRAHSLSQHQTVVCTGANTLEQLRKNLTIGGDNIPVEENAHGAPNGSDDGASDGGQEENALPALRVVMAGRFGGEDELGEQTRWKNERRETGCAFIAEGLVYADDDVAEANYAELILDGVEEVDWPGNVGAPSPPTALNDDADGELLPVGATPVSNAAIKDALSRSPVRPGAQGKPRLRIGPSLKDAKLGEIPLRVGQPYLFVHQGNNEHIWTVAEIRYLHPSDPPPFPPPSANIRSNTFKHFLPPYPLTTFLSRTSAVGKCSLCEKDPGELLTIDDELAGETPAILCRPCFELLHPPPPEKRRALAAVPGAPAAKRKKPKAEAEAEADVAPGEEVADEERMGMEGVQVVPLLVER